MQSHIYLLGNVPVTIPKHWRLFSLSRWIVISLLRPTKPLLSYNKFGKGKCHLHLNIDHGQRWEQIKGANLLYLLEEQKGHQFSEDSLFRVPQPDSPSNLASISQKNLCRNPNMTMQETITLQKLPSHQNNAPILA